MGFVTIFWEVIAMVRRTNDHTAAERRSHKLPTIRVHGLCTRYVLSKKEHETIIIPTFPTLSF